MRLGRLDCASFSTDSSSAKWEEDAVILAPSTQRSLQVRACVGTWFVVGSHRLGGAVAVRAQRARDHGHCSMHPQPWTHVARTNLKRTLTNRVLLAITVEGDEEQ